MYLYEDIAMSGQFSGWGAYDRLMAEAQQYDAIIVRERSRFGHSLQQMLNDIDDLHDVGVDLISLKEDIDLTTAQGKLFLNIIGAFNQFWVDLARERANEINGDAKRLSYGEIATIAGEILVPSSPARRSIGTARTALMRKWWNWIEELLTGSVLGPLASTKRYGMYRIFLSMGNENILCLDRKLSSFGFSFVLSSAVLLLGWHVPHPKQRVGSVLTRSIELVLITG